MDLKCTFMLFSRVLFEDPDFAQIFSEKNIEVFIKCSGTKECCEEWLCAILLGVVHVLKM